MVIIKKTTVNNHMLEYNVNLKDGRPCIRDTLVTLCKTIIANQGK